MKKLAIVVILLLILLISVCFYASYKYNKLTSSYIDDIIVRNDGYSLRVSNVKRYYTSESNIVFHLDLKKDSDFEGIILANESSIEEFVLENKEHELYVTSEGLDYLYTEELNSEGSYIINYNVHDGLNVVYDSHPELEENLYTGSYILNVSYTFSELLNGGELHNLNEKEKIKLSTEIKFEVLSFWNFNEWLFVNF